MKKLVTVKVIEKDDDFLLIFDDKNSMHVLKGNQNKFIIPVFVKEQYKLTSKRASELWKTCRQRGFKEYCINTWDDEVILKSWMDGNDSILWFEHANSVYVMKGDSKKSPIIASTKKVTLNIKEARDLWETCREEGFKRL